MKDQTLGRVVSRIVPVLMGKHKPTYIPHVDNGDSIVVVNSYHLQLTGDKWRRKAYYHHSGWPGGLKMRLAQQVHDRDPTAIVRRAVSKMLPKNQLRKARLNRLHIYPFLDHPHQAQLLDMKYFDPLGKDLVQIDQWE